MKIDRKLYLVIPVTMEDESEIFVHSTPISSDVYKNYWKVLSKTFALIGTGGFAAVGPKVAFDMLQEVATGITFQGPNGQLMNAWEGPTGVQRGLLNEIRRLSNVIAPVENSGWQAIPFDDAQSRSLINQEEYEEIEGKLIFFTACFHLFDRSARPQMLEGAFAPWRSRIHSLDCTAFTNSLVTLTKGAFLETKPV